MATKKQTIQSKYILDEYGDKELTINERLKRLKLKRQR